ncbi:ENTH-domain-containing protein [Cylindrobasidium torrendii FP15055 ss-10]|uniref:ENTH-domain-containing protein n=1 Tax=Cylindrobasidium torrendii FP15055 ss-10 TaxID=1314674 RepID=A0A0D7BGG6_9AGAR|nr:ENTH-domain-containing protein [Cylindrobasidium torrendii FP15055 ss-10]
MQHFGKSVLRVTKNYTKGYSDTQAKVRDATSNDPWGPSGTQMNEIAQLTYNQNDFVEVMEMLDKRLNDKGKNWRHVFKSLTLLDYCLHQGSENVVIYFRDNAYIIKTLKEFQYLDEEGKDQGANVRQKAKDITSLLTDESRLRRERRQRASMRDRMLRGGPGGENDEDGEPDENDHRRQGRKPAGGDEEELKKAIEESKRSHAREQEDRDMEEAIRLSKEEEDRRAKAVDDSNAAALFDDQNQLAPPNNNPFPMTMSDPTPYTVGLQPQFTAMPQQYTSIQPQFTAFNPYQQQAEQEVRERYLRQQQAMIQQQAANDEWMRQQLLLQQQQQQQQMLQQQQAQQNMFLQTQQPLTAQPTGFGSKNPFAPATPVSPSQRSPLPPPSFNLTGTYDNHNPNNLDSLSSAPSPSFSHSPSPGPSPSPSQQPSIRVAPRRDENEHLANLFANRDDGQDTFGNTGALRYGQGAGRYINQGALNTGTNPFARQEQQQQQQQQQGNDQPFFTV